MNNLGNLTDDVLERVAASPDSVAFGIQVEDSWRDLTIGEFHHQVLQVARGLIGAGIAAGDRVGLISKTRYEWTLLDYAIWWVGACTVPIYETSSAEQIKWILKDSAAVACIVESAEHYEKVRSVRPDAPSLRNIWSLHANAISEIETIGTGIDDADVESRRATIESGTLATLIYTSGTTGRPKGCMLTHGNFRFELESATSALDDLFGSEDAATLLFLPLAHVFARIIQIGAIRRGVRLGHTADITDLVNHLGTFKPTFILAVPRVFEKLYNAASLKSHADGKGKLFDAATETAIAYSKALDNGKPSIALRAKHKAFDRLVYSKMRAALGGRARHAISGGAPLGDRLAHYYRGINVIVLEGYGLTETTAALCVNTPDRSRIGTVGTPIPGTQVRAADDGELSFRGGQIFSGYWQNTAASDQVVDADGWFATGDLGEIDDDGFVRVTGRKKEILVTAGGKNVAPAILEDRMRSHAVVSQAVVVGDGKPFIAALVTIDRDSYTGDINSRDLTEAVQRAVDDANTQVSQAESIRKFVILSEDWTEENGYLTPSFKIKRNLILRDFHDEVETLFTR